MNRRNFFKNVTRFIAGAVTLRTILISYDPVKQEIIKPKVCNKNLIGYKGSEFFECGYVYAPYIPLFTTSS